MKDSQVQAIAGLRGLDHGREVFWQDEDKIPDT